MCCISAVITHACLHMAADTLLLAPALILEEAHQALRDEADLRWEADLTRILVEVTNELFNAELVMHWKAIITFGASLHTSLTMIG